VLLLLACTSAMHLRTVVLILGVFTCGLSYVTISVSWMCLQEAAAVTPPERLNAVRTPKAVAFSASTSTQRINASGFDHATNLDQPPDASAKSLRVAQTPPTVGGVASGVAVLVASRPLNQKLPSPAWCWLPHHRRPKEIHVVTARDGCDSDAAYLAPCEEGPSRTTKTVCHVWDTAQTVSWREEHGTAGPSGIQPLPGSLSALLDSRDATSRVDFVEVVLPKYTEPSYWRDGASKTGRTTAALQFAAVGVAMEAVLGSGPSNQPARVRIHRHASQNWKHLQQAAHMPFLWPHEVECVASQVNGDGRVCRGTSGGSDVLMQAVADVSRPWVQYLVQRHRHGGDATGESHTGTTNVGFDALVRRVPWERGWLSPRPLIQPLVHQARGRARPSLAAVAIMFHKDGRTAPPDVCGALTLGYSLRMQQHHGFSVDLVALVDEHILGDVRPLLLPAGWKVRAIQRIFPPQGVRAWRQSLTKLHMLNVSGYDGVMMLDVDVIPWAPGMLASAWQHMRKHVGLASSTNSDGGMYFNSGVLTVPPSSDLMNLALALLSKLTIYNSGDQVGSGFFYFEPCRLFAQNMLTGDDVLLLCVAVCCGVCQGFLNELFMYWSALPLHGCSYSRFRHAVVLGGGEIITVDSQLGGSFPNRCHQVLHYVGSKKPWQCGYNRGRDCNDDQPAGIMNSDMMHRAWWARAQTIAQENATLRRHQRSMYVQQCKVPMTQRQEKVKRSPISVPRMPGAPKHGAPKPKRGAPKPKRGAPMPKVRIPKNPSKPKSAWRGW